MTLTLRNCYDFVRIRNNADFHNNLQVMIDASTAGFDITKLPQRAYSWGCVWETAHGLIIEDLQNEPRWRFARFTRYDRQRETRQIVRKLLDA